MVPADLQAAPSRTFKEKGGGASSSQTPCCESSFCPGRGPCRGRVLASEPEGTQWGGSPHCPQSCSGVPTPHDRTHGPPPVRALEMGVGSPPPVSPPRLRQEDSRHDDLISVQEDGDIPMVPVLPDSCPEGALAGLAIPTVHIMAAGTDSHTSAVSQQRPPQARLGTSRTSSSRLVLQDVKVDSQE